MSGYGAWRMRCTVDTPPRAWHECLRVEQYLKTKNLPCDAVNAVFCVKMGNLSTPYTGATVALY